MFDIKLIDELFETLNSKDDKARFSAFQQLLKMTEEKVEWVYDKWFVLTEKLKSENSYQRSIGLLLLANLCKSDTDNKFADISELYLSFFEDEKFITSRQCIQNSWKIALSSENNNKKIVSKLKEIYYAGIHHSSHGNLIKQDVISSLSNILKNSKKSDIAELIDNLIESENDEKLKKALRKAAK